MTKTKVEIESFPEKSLSEIYQDVDLKFAFVSRPKDGYKQCHGFVKCRDFLQDAVCAEFNGSEAAIYGFHYKAGVNPPMSLNKMRMLVKKVPSDSDEIFEEQMSVAEKLLRHYEDMAGWSSKTMTYGVKRRTNLRLFVSPKEWVKASHMISLYSLLIRLGAYGISFNNDEELQNEYSRLIKELAGKGKYERYPIDIKYLLQIKPENINLIIQNTDKLIFEKGAENYPKVDIYTMHNRSGVVSLCDSSHFSKKLVDIFLRLRKERGI